VGRAQRDGADHAVAELLLHFQRDFGVVHLQCVIDVRDRVPRELDVNDGTDDLDDLALAHCGFLELSDAACRSGVSRDSCDLPVGRGRGRSYMDWGQTAAAPPTISEISWVIAACRALL